MECGDDEAAEDMVLCSDCLELGPPQTSIRVSRDRLWSDWTMKCWTHNVSGTYDNWQDAYEAALGHACMTHTLIAVCSRRGHDWQDEYRFVGASDMYVCRRCGEVGYEVFDRPVVAFT